MPPGRPIAISTTIVLTATQSTMKALVKKLEEILKSDIDGDGKLG